MPVEGPHCRNDVTSQRAVLNDLDLIRAGQAQEEERKVKTHLFIAVGVQVKFLFREDSRVSIWLTKTLLMLVVTDLLWRGWALVLRVLFSFFFEVGLIRRYWHAGRL